MITPTLRELLDRATPGPHQARFIYRMIRAARATPGLFFSSPKENDWADSELIARCSPATLRAVMEALETAKADLERLDTEADALGGPRPSITIITRALALLNGEDLLPGDRADAGRK